MYDSLSISTFVNYGAGRKKKCVKLIHLSENYLVPSNTSACDVISLGALVHKAPPALCSLSPEALVTVSMCLRIRLGGLTMTSRSGCSQSLKCHLLPQTPQELNTKLSPPVYSGPGAWGGQVMFFFCH